MTSETVLDEWMRLIRDAENGLGGQERASWARRIDQSHPAPDEAVRALVDAGRILDVLEAVPTLAAYWQATGQPGHGHAVLSPIVAAIHEGPLAARAGASVSVSLLAFRSGMSEEARTSAEAGLSLARESGDDAALVRALAQRARIGLRDGDLETVRSVCVDGLAAAERIGDESHRRLPLHCLAEATRLGGDLDGARPLYVDSIELNTRLGNADMVAMERSNLAALETAAGRVDRAADLLLEAIPHIHAAGDLYLLPYALLNAAGVLLAAGDRVDGARLLGAADGIFERTGMAIDPADRPVFDRHLHDARTALGEEGFAAAFAAGGTSTAEDAVGAALAGLERHRGETAPRG